MRPAARVPTSRPGSVLVAFLLALMAYAAFGHGATSLGEQALVQTAVAIAVTVAVGLWLWHKTPPVGAPRLARIGLGLLAAFALWSALSLAWSIAPDRTVLDTGRAFTYVMTAGLGVAAASWWRDAAPRLAVGYLVLAVLIALYALGGKVAPGLHVGGLFDLNHTQLLPRLRAPLDYWNAVGLALLMATPIALAVLLDGERTPATRLACLGCLQILMVTLALTYSRGAVVALVAAVVIFAVLSRRGLAVAVMFALAAVAAIPSVLYAFTTHSMTAVNQPLGDRQRDGLILLVILLASLVGLLLSGRAVLRVEQGLRLTPRAARRLAVAMAGVAAVGLFGGGIALAASKDGLTGTISREWASFRKVKYDPLLDPQHLITTNAGNRWTWWSEAAGAWSDRPLRGWGNGSFPILHHEYRNNQLEIQQPHSVPMQLLSETGLLGLILAMGGMVALALVGVSARRAPPEASEPGAYGERLLRAALAAAICAWLIHGLYDWDLDIPGVSIPALAFMGLLAGRVRPPESRTPRVGTPARVLALVAIAAATSAIALWSILPAWADSKAAGAVALAGSGHASASDQRRAARAADLAAGLNPTATKPLLALASIKQGQGDLKAARAALRRATKRQPSDGAAWSELAMLEMARRDLPAARAAVRRALALNPRDVSVRMLAEEAQVRALNRSATAVRTPLPALPGRTEARG